MVEEVVEELSENKKVISLIIIGLITIAMFTIYIYSYLNRNHEKPSSKEIQTLNLHAREIINEERHTRNVISNVERNDMSNYLLVEGANFELQQANITKDGVSSDNDKSRVTGQNSAIVTAYKAHFSLYTSKIDTLSVGANAIYTSGTNASSEIYDTDISTERPYSSGFVASNGGSIKSNNVTIFTKSYKSPTIDTVTSDSEINVTSSLLETNGATSPLVYASGKVSIDRSTGSSFSSPIAILEKTGDVFFHESTFLAAAGGVPDGFEPTGILIYGDKKDIEPQKFNSTNSSLNIDRNYPFYNTASMFYIKDTNAEITLINSRLNFGSGVLAYLYDSDVTLTLSNNHLEGNILLNGTSTLNLNLTYASNYDIALNNENIKISLDINSTLNLVGDTYIGELTNADPTNSNINFNSYHLYVKGVPIN